MAIRGRLPGRPRATRGDDDVRRRTAGPVDPRDDVVEAGSDRPTVHLR